MDKIYSRAKIKIPNGINRKKKKTIVIFIILLIAFSTIKITLDAISPIFDTLCENEAKSIATKISNEQATEVMKEHTYDELFSIEKDNNGNITMIKSNVIPINEIISDVAIKIQNEINNQGRENIQIALRKFYRS
ncbi:MAG: hypothetical protein KH434_07345 [Clostridium sp.]|nr:hypothetical protein [Clostridium sp.]